MLKEEIIENESKNMALAVTAIEEKLTAFSHIATTINTTIDERAAISDENTTSLAELIALPTLENVSNYTLIKTSLLLADLSSNTSDLLYCYLPNSDMCLSSTQNTTSRTFFESHYTETDTFTYDTWLNMLKSFSYSKYMLTSNAYGEPCIDFFYSMPLKDVKSSPTMCCVIRLYYSDIEHILKEQLGPDNKNLYIVDSNNNLIFENAKISSIVRPTYDRKYKTITSADDSISIAKPFSQNSWILITAIPNNVINQKLEYLTVALWLIIILCLVTSIIMARFFAFVSYNPIRKMLNIVKKSDSDTKTDYEMIEEALEHLRDQKATLRKIRHNNDMIERDRLLSNLLTGSPESHSSVCSALRRHNISFDSSHFAVIIFYIKDSNLFGYDETSDEQMNNNEKADTIKFIIRNVFEEIMTHKHKAYVFEFNGLLMSIANISSNHLSTWQSDITDAIRQTESVMEENFNFSFIACVSNVHPTTVGLKAAFDEATKAFNYRTLIKRTDILTYGDIDNDIKEPLPGSEKERQLLNFIKLGDYDVAIKILDELIEEFTVNNDVANTEFFTLRLMCSVASLSSQSSEFSDIDNYKPLFSLIVDAFNNDIRGDYYELLCKIIKNSCEIHSKLTISQNAVSEISQDTSIKTNIIDNIKEYINQHYMDPNLNVAAVGYYFDVTPYYMSNLFKKSEGLSILEYITKTRIEASLELLKDNITIAKIAEEVGFNNTNTYIRQFSKLMGCSPTQYKATYEDNL